MNLRHLAAALLLMLSLTACGGDDEKKGVATLTDDKTASAKPTEAAGDLEEDLIDYVRCLRGEGIDVPDPTVDEDGNVVLEPDASATAPPDLSGLSEALEACGPVPASILSSFGGNLTTLQDDALEFAGCMRDQGLDFPDPDFSQGLAGAADIFKNLDLTDPKFQAAAEKCRGAFQGTEE